jgi:hypothetical protein
MFPDLDLVEIQLISPANLADLSRETPEFTWANPVGASLTAAVFRQPPRFDTSAADAVINVEDIVWIWYSMLPGAHAGPTQTTAFWNTGRAVTGGTSGLLDPMQVSAAPPTAPQNGVYYWSVWGWKGSDYKLAFRSAIRTFAVNGETITGLPCSSNCPGTVATRCSNRDYCLIACASDQDCYESSLCDLSVVGLVSFGICRDKNACMQMSEDSGPSGDGSAELDAGEPEDASAELDAGEPEDAGTGVVVKHPGRPGSPCPCAADSGTLCDEELGICYQPAASETPGGAACGCRVGSRGNGLSAVLTTLATLALIVRRRATNRPS